MNLWQICYLFHERLNYCIAADLKTRGSLMENFVVDSQMIRNADVTPYAVKH